MLEKLFSIKNEKAHKIVWILGTKFKFLSKKLLYKQLKKIPIYGESSMLNLYLLDKCNALTIETKKKIIQQKFYEMTGEFPDLKNPRTFNEKLNWMKLYYNQPLQKRCVDKYEFKKYIEENLGKDYVIPLIGVYDDVDDIDLDKLPKQFVIKSTLWGSGTGVTIVKDKNQINWDHIKYRFTRFLEDWKTVYYGTLPSTYEGLKPRIIIEEYVQELTEEECDYKLFCFHGKVKCFYIANNFANSAEHILTYYDLKFNKLPVKYCNYKVNNNVIKSVNNFDKMIELAEKLAAPFPFVRVDFYNLKNRVLLSEMTFTPGGGFGIYTPKEWDYKLGEFLDLNNLNPEYLVK